MARVWTCKIGTLDNGLELPDGADLPMRMAVKEAYERITGKDAEFCFSGWGGQLTESEETVAKMSAERRANG